MAISNRSQQSTAVSNPSETQTRSMARRHDADPFWGFGGDLFRVSPFALLSMMTDQMDRAFSNSFGSRQQGDDSSTAWIPALEAREQDGNLFVIVDLPGIDPNDVKVEVNQNTLTIQGERKRQFEDVQGATHRSERVYGRFYRATELPEGAQTDQAHGEFRNGVLELKIPLSHSTTNRRQIPITATSGTTSYAAGVAGSSGSGGATGQNTQNQPLVGSKR